MGRFRSRRSLLVTLSAGLPCAAYANVFDAVFSPFGLLILAALLAIIGLDEWLQFAPNSGKYVTNLGHLTLLQDSSGHHIVWDNTTRKVLCRLRDDDFLETALFSPDLRTLAGIAEGVPTLRLWDTQSGSLLWSNAGSDGHPPVPNVSYGSYDNRTDSIAFSPDSQLLAVSGASDDDKADDDRADDDKADDASEVGPLPDGRRYDEAIHRGAVCVWELRAFQLQALLHTPQMCPSVRFADDGCQLIIEDDGTTFHYDCDNWKLSKVDHGRGSESPR